MVQIVAILLSASTVTGQENKTKVVAIEIQDFPDLVKVSQ